MAAAETPSMRAFDASASACGKTGWTSIVSILRAASAMPQLPDRNRVVRRLLVYECVSLQRRLHHLEIELLHRCEAVEPEAPHEQVLTDQNIVLGSKYHGSSSRMERLRRYVSFSVVSVSINKLNYFTSRTYSDGLNV